MFPHPCLYAGDSNCQHVNWDYSITSPDGESLDGWVTKSNIALLHNPKDAPSFFLSLLTWQPYRYLRKWKLKLSRPTTKTVTAAFHLYHKEAASELKVASEGRILPFSAEPTCLGVKMDRSLTFRRHLESLRKKLTTRVAFLRRLVGSSWGAGARTLRLATLALIHSAAEYCAPVWSRSAHTRLIDKPINNALRLMTGCLRPTPTDKLFVLSGIT